DYTGFFDKVKGKWRSLYYNENPCESMFGCPEITSKEVRGFEKTTEYSNLSSLVNSLYWKRLQNEDDTKNKEAFIIIYCFRFSSSHKKLSSCCIIRY
ncbi:hypothetical protein, partial [Mycoplasmopsis bovis]|uniref:hypothetical protein n=1 Tax=Mycoplasmopsis bovis TaxID=28903 RepID=UPI003D27E5C2